MGGGDKLLGLRVHGWIGTGGSWENALQPVYVYSSGHIYHLRARTLCFCIEMLHTEDALEHSAYSYELKIIHRAQVLLGLTPQLLPDSPP